MDVSVKKTGPISAEIDFIIGKNEVEQEILKFCDEIKDRVQVDGFRKGQAPINVIRQKFNEVIKAEVSTRIIHTRVEEAAKQKNLKIAGNPTLKEEFRVNDRRRWLGDFKLDGRFIFGITTELEPEVDITDYKGIKVAVDLPAPKVWVDAKIKRLQYEFAEKELVNRPIQATDEVVLDYSGSIDGHPIENGTESWRTIVVGSGEFPPEIEAELIGKNTDQEFTSVVKFNQDLAIPMLAGKTATFDFKIHSITEVRLHPVNDELAQKAVYENLEQMIKELRTQAEEEFEKPRKAKIIEAIISEILVRHPFQVPNAWIDNEMRVVAYRAGLQEMPTDEKQLNSLRNIAHRSVQQSFIFDKIYQKEKEIHFTGEEMQALLAKEGERLNKTAGEVLGLLKNSGQYEGFVSAQEHWKTMDFLIQSSVIEEIV